MYIQLLCYDAATDFAMQGIAAKLGAAIKNQRLADIVAHRPQAAVRSLKWLIGILDNVLKQADTNLKKGSAMLSVPDLTFGGFQRKYGDLMASEYMASLVNTVAKYRLVSSAPAVLALLPIHCRHTHTIATLGLCHCAQLLQDVSPCSPQLKSLLYVQKHNVQ